MRGDLSVREPVHMWEQRKRDATSAGIGPASGSLDGDEPYAGSRRVKQRFEYSENSKAAFVELHQDWYPHKNKGPQLFKELLEKVQGVDRVKWQTSKTSQGNEGNQYCERNLLVYSKMLGPGYDHKPMEFELTRHQHTDDPEVVPTLTAMRCDACVVVVLCLSVCLCAVSYTHLTLPPKA